MPSSGSKHHPHVSQGCHHFNGASAPGVLPDSPPDTGEMPAGKVMQESHPGHAHPRASVTELRPTQPTAEQVEYTCPMHPQIRRLEPGNCPICGMALEPVVATAETQESPELRDMSRRFWIGAALTLPVFGLEMGGHLTDLNHLLGQQLSNWIQFVLGTPVVLWAGWPFFVRAAASVKNRSLNMFSLIALGTGAARLYSVVGTAAPQLFPADLRLPDDVAGRP